MLILRSIAEPNMNRIREILWDVEWCRRRGGRTDERRDRRTDGAGMTIPDGPNGPRETDDDKTRKPVL